MRNRLQEMTLFSDSGFVLFRIVCLFNEQRSFSPVRLDLLMGLRSINELQLMLLRQFYHTRSSSLVIRESMYIIFHKKGTG